MARNPYEPAQASLTDPVIRRTKLFAVLGPKTGLLVAFVNLWLMSGIGLFGFYFSAMRVVAITSGVAVAASLVGIAALSPRSSRATIVCAYVLNVLLWLFGALVAAAAVQEFARISGLRLTTFLGALLLVPATTVIVELWRRRRPGTSVRMNI